jgi:DNA-binding FrmR family transcriptional regulator
MDAVIKRQVSDRLARAEGHLKKVRSMVDNEAYCPDIIHQSKAVQAALKKVDELVLHGHLHTCVFDEIQGTKSKKEKLIEEIVGLFKYDGK